MTLHIREVYDKHFSEVKIDSNLCRRIINYTMRYMNASADHVAFFGGVLMGVYSIKFLDSDKEIWYDDVLMINEDLLKADLLKADYIEPSHVVSSDPYNYIPGYLTLRLNGARGIPNNLKREAQECLFIMLHSKYMGSLMARRFRYPARKEIMEETFAALNYKFDIKFIGSWERLFRDRADSIIRQGSIYDRYLNERLSKGDDQDYWAKRIVTDTQSRLRELVNKYYSLYIEILESGRSVRVTSDIGINTDGEMILRDITTGYSTYLNYIKNIVTDKGSFIRPELVNVIESTISSMPSHLFIRALEHMSDNFNFDHDRISKFMDNSVIFAFNLMQSERSSLRRTQDLKGLMTKVRSKLMAPKNTEPEIVIIREFGERLIRDAINIRNPAVIASVRSGCVLYLVLRTMTKNHYSR